jgi:hypothetical protein
MRVLVIDIGGTHLKIMATGHDEERQVPSGPTLSARDMVEVAMITRSVSATVAGPIGTRVRIRSGNRKLRGCGERSMRPAFSIITETASVAMKPVTCGAPRIGRNTARSMVMPASAPVSSTTAATRLHGVPARPGRVSRTRRSSPRRHGRS